MKWTLAKDNDVVLEGYKVDIDRTDHSLNCVTLTNTNGGQLRIRMENYNLKMEVPAPPKMVTKFLLSGDYKGLVVHELFDHEYQAESRRYELSEELTIQQTKVEEEE